MHVNVGDAPSTRAGGRRVSGPELAVLSVVAIVALVHLSYPFGADQSLFTVYARAMHGGDVLYRDVWDIKQPGIFLFYLAGGSLFGFREVGIHLFEGLYFLAFAVVLQRAFRGRLAHPWIAAAVPLFAVVPYWATATNSELTQVEALVGFPLFVACVGVSDLGDDRAPGTWPLFFTGLAGAAVGYFKLVYLPIVLAVWAIAIVGAMRSAGRQSVLRRCRPLFIGFAVPVVIAFVYFAAFGLVGEVFWTYVVFPWKKRALDMRDLERLRIGLRHLGRGFAWTVPLAAFAALPPRRSRDGLVRSLVVWLVLGTALALIQLWYPYEFLILIVPLGLLAAVGFDRLVTALRTAPGRPTVMYAALAASALLALLPARTLAGKSLTFVRDDATLTAAGRERFEDKYGANYVVARRAVTLLDEPDAIPGPIHLMGDYTLLFRSGRRPAIATTGDTVEELDDRLWRRTREELAEAQPPYVFVSDFADEIMAERSPQTRAFLDRRYCSVRDASDGRWLGNRRSGACPS